MDNRIEIPPLITLNDYSDSFLNTVRFGGDSGYGLDEINLKINIDGHKPWNITIQAIDLNNFISKSIILKEKNHDSIFIISYGGNVVFGKASLINTFSELKIGGCIFIDKFANGKIAIVLGFTKIAIIDSIGNHWQEEHDMQDYLSWSFDDGSIFSVNYTVHDKTKKRIYRLSPNKLALEISSES